MFGIDDWIFSKRKVEMEDERPVEPSVTGFDNGDIWFLFLPGAVVDRKSLMKNYLPSSGLCLTYRIPSDTAIPFTNPYRIRTVFDRIYKHAIDEADIFRKRGRRIKTLGASIGTSVQSKVVSVDDELAMLVLTGDSFVEGVGRNLATRKSYIINRNKNKSTRIDFRKQLTTYDPAQNAANFPQNVEVVLSRWDRMIPYAHGQGFVEALELEGRKPKVKVRKLYGHTLTLAKFKNQY